VTTILITAMILDSLAIYKATVDMINQY